MWAIRHFRNKMAELAMNSMNKNSIEICGVINDLKGVTSPEVT
jgi:hypothetical protein